MTNVLCGLTAVSSVALIGAFDHFVGEGIAGGYMDSHARDAVCFVLLVMVVFLVVFVNRLVRARQALISLNATLETQVEERTITERKRMEELERQQAAYELDKSEERYQQLFNTSLDGILLIESDGSIFSANPAACRMFQRSEEEIIRIGRNGLLDPSDPHLLQALEERGRTGSFSGVLTYVRKDGTKFPGEVTSVLYKDKDGISHGSTFIRDITERKQAEEVQQKYLAQLQRLTQQVISVQETERRHLSRELHDDAGQSLAVLKISLQLMEDDIPARMQPEKDRVEELVRLTDSIINKTRRISHLLRPPELDTIGLNASLEGLCLDFAKHTQMTIKYRGTPTGDQDDALNITLYRFLQEALTNAAKHAHANHIWVFLIRHAKSIRLTVKDDGKGFSPGLLTQAQGQRGVGLSGMRERLEILNGNLMVESEENRGTTLSAEIPLAETPQITDKPAGRYGN